MCVDNNDDDDDNVNNTAIAIISTVNVMRMIMTIMIAKCNHNDRAKSNNMLSDSNSCPVAK